MCVSDGMSLDRVAAAASSSGNLGFRSGREMAKARANSAEKLIPVYLMSWYVPKIMMMSRLMSDVMHSAGCVRIAWLRWLTRKGSGGGGVEDGGGVDEEEGEEEEEVVENVVENVVAWRGQ